MANEKSVEMRLPSLDELFSSQEERDDAKLKRIYEIPLEEIDPFPDHPFKVQDDEDMMNLAESIRTNGILTPATVRKKEDGRYELLSGHRRLRACQIAGIPTLRCEIVEMSLDEATIFMVYANFQRSKILPSVWAPRSRPSSKPPPPPFSRAPPAAIWATCASGCATAPASPATSP